MSNKPQTEKPNAPEVRVYQKPVLAKGPVLTNVTAIKSVSGSAPAPGCWIARAAFGETDIRWMIFREWLVVEAPAWFRELYIRHGDGSRVSRACKG
jgi:hypothetical protein